MRFFQLGLLLCCFLSTNAQELLQLEIKNSTKRIKFFPGQNLTYKTKEFPNTWKSNRIQKVSYDDQLVYFKHSYEAIEDIIAIKEYVPVAKKFARMLYSFGMVSGVYTLIDKLAGQNRITDSQIIYASAITTVGVFLDLVVAKKVYCIGRNTRLRLLDLRMQ